MSYKLSFCSNIFPGSDFDSHWLPLKSQIANIKKQLNWTSFSLALRVAAPFAVQLNQSDTVKKFDDDLNELNCKLYTINAFPYGEFHKTPVKEMVYQPDWTSNARVDYTINIIRGVGKVNNTTECVSISTVPIGYKTLHSKWNQEIENTVAGNLNKIIETCIETEQQTGKRVVLAFEPEPDCFLQTIDDVIWFFKDWLPSSNVYKVYKEEVVNRYIGLCIDSCHLAVEFESTTGISKLIDTDIPIFKCQISAALAARGSHKRVAELLSPFSEPTYLHQTRVKCGEKIIRFNDLPMAIDNQDETIIRNTTAEWRVHFHTPLYCEQIQDSLWSTSNETSKVISGIFKFMTIPHFEVETYTYNIYNNMKSTVQRTDISESIVKEIKWAQQLLTDL